MVKGLSDRIRDSGSDAIVALAVGTMLVVLPGCDERAVEVEDPVEVTSASVDGVGHPLVRELGIELERRAAVEVIYGTAEAQELRIASELEASEHQILLPRLKADSDYTFEVRAVGRDGSRGEPLIGDFATGDLPPELAALQVQTEGEPTEPLILLEVPSTSTGFTGLVVVDREGSIVWYVESAGELFGSTRRENGNLVYLDNAAGLVEVAPHGEIVATLPQVAGGEYGEIHHDVVATPQNTLYFLAREIATVDGEEVTGEAIWEWNPETGDLSRKWNSFDFLDWELDRGTASAAENWMHANSLSIGPRDNIVMSSRNLNQILSISSDFEELEWRLSGPRGSFELIEEDRFWGQHYATELESGRVLLFDNGFDRPNGELFSRALEIEIDPAAGEAEKVWEFRQQPDHFSARVGAAHRLSSGNTMVTFGWLLPDGIEVHEVTEAGETVWHMAAGEDILKVYRATPLSDIAGEERVN